MTVKKYILIAGIILFGFFLRTYGLNWDQDHHLHPDERFLTMVATASKVPTSLSHYLDESTSTLNPYNLNSNFFVYGTLPLTINKLAVHYLKIDTYDHITIFGRLLSGLYDTITILIVFKITELFVRDSSKKNTGHIQYMAAFLYAVAVLPIQNAHFFTVDSLLNMTALTSFYFSLRYYYSKKLMNVVLSGIFLGLAFASKIAALYIVPLIGAMLIISNFPFKKKNIKSLFVGGLLFASFTYVSLRLGDPRMLTSHFIENIKQLQAMANPDGWFPPLVQWLNKKPMIFSLKNIAFFGLGIPYFVAVVIGSAFFPGKKRAAKILTLAWCLIFFLYQSVQLASSMRYFYFLYPFFAIFGAYGLSRIDKKYIFGALLAIMVWPMSFMSIYTRPHSRVAASEWIYSNIKPGSSLTAEHWDDALPLSLDQSRYTQRYSIVELPVFEYDTPEKWQRMNELLAKADYLILSSNRGYGSITTVPERYPEMTRFYHNLFAGKTQFKKVYQATSYPTINMGFASFSIPDQWSEEAFTVYDHPKVTIFKKMP